EGGGGVGVTLVLGDQFAGAAADLGVAALGGAAQGGQGDRSQRVEGLEGRLTLSELRRAELLHESLGLGRILRGRVGDRHAQGQRQRQHTQHGWAAQLHRLFSQGDRSTKKLSLK